MRLPLLPLRDIVIFPDMIVPLFVGREKSVIAVEKVMKGQNKDKRRQQKGNKGYIFLQVEHLILGSISTQ